MQRKGLISVNKQELVTTISKLTGITQKTVNAIITVTLEEITETVAEGDKVVLVGFGSFERKNRSAREGRNPKTGEVMEIPARQVPAFSAGKLFKDAVAAGKFPEENRVDYHKRLHQSWVRAGFALNRYLILNLG